MKVNLKTTNEAENSEATSICHQRGQRTVNGIIGNTRRGIRVDQTLDPDSNNPVANKPVSAALAALVGKIDAALQKPTGLTKTKLVGVGTNGQENIEIGDNLTLANGKLSATGGGSSDTRNVLVTTDMRHYTGTIDPNKNNVLVYNEKVYQIVEIDGSSAIAISGTELDVTYLFEIYLLRDDGNFHKKQITKIYSNGVKTFYHFITIMNRENDIVNVALSTDKYQWNMWLDDLLDYMTDSENIMILATGYIGGNPVLFVVIDYSDSTPVLKACSYDTTNKEVIATTIDNSYRFADIRGEAPR